MPFDLSAVSATAQRVASESGGNERRTYKYPLMYPGTEGTITGKFLFNPKSQAVARLIRRHKINDVNQPCARTWDHDCPICNALKEIENVTGKEHPQMRSTVRGISFFQFVSATYDVDNINPGDIILLMYPWTIYKDLNQILKQAENKEDLAQIIASNDGLLVNVIHDKDFRYSAQINAFTKQRTCNTDQEFENLLNGLDSLNEQILPAEYDQDMQNKVNEIAEEIRAEYITPNPRMMNTNPSVQQVQNPMQAFQNTQQMMSQMGQPQIPMNQSQQVMPTGMDPDIPFNNGVQTATMPTVPQASASPSQNIVNGQPECFGRHGDPDIDSNTCLLCPSEIQCAQVSGN